MGLSNTGRVVAITAAVGGTRIALVTSTPTDTSSGAEVPTANTGYARQTWTTTYTSANPTLAVNRDEVLFPVALRDWGTVSHVVLLTTGGEYRARMELLNPIDEVTPMPRHVQPGDQLRFPAGALRFEVI